MSFREIILIHFDTNITNVYQVDDNRLKLIKNILFFLMKHMSMAKCLISFKNFFNFMKRK